MSTSRPAAVIASAISRSIRFRRSSSTLIPLWLGAVPCGRWLSATLRTGAAGRLWIDMLSTQANRRKVSTPLRHLCGAALVALLVAGCGSAAIPTKPTTPAAPLASRTLLDVSGNGIKETQSFAAPAAWQVSYTFDCGATDGLFAIYVYQSGTLSGVAANQIARTGTDTSYQHQAGETYFTVNTTCSWRVQAKT